MEVYVKTKEDWINFVNGRHVKLYKQPVADYVKKILVAPIEIIKETTTAVIVEKRY